MVTIVEQLDERTVDLTIDSPSVGEAKVRLLLPTALADDPDATYPVLYLCTAPGTTTPAGPARPTWLT